MKQSLEDAIRAALKREWDNATIRTVSQTLDEMARISAKEAKRWYAERERD